MDLAGAVHAVVVLVNPANLRRHFYVANRSRRRRARLRGVVRARCDLDPSLGEGATDRLDTELMLAIVDELHDQ